MARQFVVIGCHGSGVEAIAGVMHLLGVRSGNLPFAVLNTRILRDAGGSWDKPPHWNAIDMVGDHDDAMERLVNKRDASGDVWGWADPQTCLTMSKWAPFLSAPTFLWVSRSTRAIMAEMNARHGIDAAQSRTLMSRYLADAGLFLAGEHNGRLVCMNYDQMRDDPIEQVDVLSWWLRVEPRATQKADAVAYIGGLDA